jgi:hypothetical protein
MEEIKRSLPQAHNRGSNRESLYALEIAQQLELC